MHMQQCPNPPTYLLFDAAAHGLTDLFVSPTRPLAKVQFSFARNVEVVSGPGPLQIISAEIAFFLDVPNLQLL